MIIAMIPMGMMKMTINEVIDMITMWNSLVSTIGTVNMTCFVAAALMMGCTNLRVDVINIKSMLINMITMYMMKVTIMKIIYVIVVHDSSRPAVFTMNMRMIVVLCAFVHASLLWVSVLLCV